MQKQAKMYKQEIQFAVQSKDGIVQAGKSAILQPKPNYSGEGIRWYEDKLKEETKPQQ